MKTKNNHHNLILLRQIIMTFFHLNFNFTYTRGRDKLTNKKGLIMGKK